MKFGLIATALVAIICLITTFSVIEFARRSLIHVHEEEFQELSFEVMLSSEAKIVSYMHSLQGLNGLYAASKSVERNEFEEFLLAIGKYRRLPESRLIFYVESVPASQNAEFVESIRKDISLDLAGISNYAIYPAQNRTDYYPIKYVKEYNPSNFGLGFDLGSLPEVLLMMESARDSGDHKTYSQLLISTDDGAQEGFLLVIPVYRNGVPLSTVEERRNASIGYLGVIDSYDSLFKGLNFDAIHNDSFVIELYEGEKKVIFKNELVWASGSYNPDDIAYSVTLPMVADAQNWTLVLTAVESLVEHDPIHIYLPAAILFVGFFISFLFSGLIFSATTSKARALHYARQITKELKEQQDSLRAHERAFSAATSGIVITNPNRKDNPVVYVNPAYEKVTGYSAEEVIGKNLRFLHKEDYKQEGLTVLREAIKNKKSCEVILKDYRKDGSMFNASLSMAPVFEDTGKLVNFVGILNDITERMNAETQLKSRTEELEKFQELTVDREIRMNELKKQMEELRQKVPK
ncbi:MAG: CHASE domain-containing protein [Nanoarchaeota archaeon]